MIWVSRKALVFDTDAQLREDLCKSARRVILMVGDLGKEALSRS